MLDLDDIVLDIPPHVRQIAELSEGTIRTTGDIVVERFRWAFPDGLDGS
jgi:hypothetical protein